MSLTSLLEPTPTGMNYGPYFEIEPPSMKMMDPDCTASDALLQLIPVGHTIGYWQVCDGYYIGQLERPSRWRRFWTRRLLGWEWKDTPKE